MDLQRLYRTYKAIRKSHNYLATPSPILHSSQDNMVLLSRSFPPIPLLLTPHPTISPVTRVSIELLLKVGLHAAVVHIQGLHDVRRDPVSDVREEVARRGLAMTLKGLQCTTAAITGCIVHEGSWEQICKATPDNNIHLLPDPCENNFQHWNIHGPWQSQDYLQNHKWTFGPRANPGYPDAVAISPHTNSAVPWPL